jgi:Raf kinase inhibitor-like YbhB/YbcL family protein
MPPMDGLRRLSIALLTLGLAAGCATPAGTSVTSAAAVTPSPASPTPASPTPASSASQPGESTMAFTLTSTAFTEGGAIPRKFSCDGDNVSPPLNWEGAPDDTASLALIVDDPDASGFVHWVVFNMTASQSGGLPEGFSSSPDAPPQGTNSRGTIGWTGPCPPSGTHHYNFTLLALDLAIDQGGTPKADEIRRAAEGHTLAQAVLTGTFKRG